jgi:hypothetical protein
MSRKVLVLVGVGLLVSALCASSAGANPYSFSTGNPDGKMAMGSRPAGSGPAEIEAADDFAVEGPTIVRSATFTGLIPSLSSIQRVRVEIYAVFPVESDTSRTSGPPLFSTPQVPTRVNSPADTQLAAADSAEGGLTFTAADINPSFFSLNSVLNGINPKPNQTTGGDGSVSGEEWVLKAQIDPPLNLAAGHYFFVPQVITSTGDFFWLSAPRPVSSEPDFQTWIRDAGLAPDWLRVGTDIVGGATPPTFNGAFSLAGTSCPPISVAPTALPDATAGHAYSVSLTASGGIAPYTFTESGALPSGISLTSAGTLAGTPASAGSFPIRVEATDSESCRAGVDEMLTVRGGGNSTGAELPDTKITKVKIDRTKGRARFRFRAAGQATSFQCALTKKHRKPSFRNCRSPKAYRGLGHGRYLFEVRAVGPAGPDPTPAKRRFRLD